MLNETFSVILICFRLCSRLCCFQNFAEDDATGDDARPLYRCKVDPTGANCGNMLVSDFALAYEFTVDDTTRFLDCDPSGSALTCQKASTYDLVKAYAEV